MEPDAMIAPPRLFAWVLEHALAQCERDAVVGDLCEEFNAFMVPQRGVWSARWWYRVQVVRSLAPLFFRSWERASLGRASAAIVGAALAGTAPAAALIMLRAFVLQQVPLKTASEPSLFFVTALLLVVLATAGMGCVAAVAILNAERRKR
jgi:hypothetical protein